MFSSHMRLPCAYSIRRWQAGRRVGREYEMKGTGEWIEFWVWVAVSEQEGARERNIKDRGAHMHMFISTTLTLAPKQCV